MAAPFLVVGCSEGMAKCVQIFQDIRRAKQIISLKQLAKFADSMGMRIFLHRVRFSLGVRGVEIRGSEEDIPSRKELQQSQEVLS